MKHFLLFIAIIFFTKSAEAQPTYVKRISFNKNPGYLNPQDSILHLRHFAACPDGNSIIEIDEWRGIAKICKLDLNGNIIWQTLGSYHGGNNRYTTAALKATPDGGCVYIQNHYGSSSGVTQNAYITKLGSMGNVEWITQVQPQDICGNSYQVAYDIAVLPTGYACLATDSIYRYNLYGGSVGTINRRGPGKLHGFADGDLFVEVAGLRAKIDSLGNTILSFNNQVVYNDTTFYTIIIDTLHRIDPSNGNYLSSVYFPPTPGIKLQILTRGDWITYNTNQIFKYDPQGNLAWIETIPQPHFGMNLVGEQSDGTLLTGGTYLSSYADYTRYDYSTFVGTIDSTGHSILDKTSQYWTLDANDDSIVEFADLVYVALAFGSTGPSRVDLAVQNEFIYPGGDIAVDFQGSFANGVNHKHSDFAADGVIDSLDIASSALALAGHMRARRTLWRVNRNSTGVALPYFSCIPEKDSVSAGDTVRIYFVIGDNSFSVDSIFGLAFMLDFDTLHVGNIGSVIDLEFIDNDLGNLSDQRTALINNYSGVAMMTGRKDLQNAYSIADTLGFADIRIYPNATGSQDLNFSVRSFRAITAGGFPIELQFDIKPVHILPLINNVKENLENKIGFYPNPVKNSLIIEGLPNEQLSISIYNHEGKECFVGSSKNSNVITLNTDKYTNGIYFLVIRDANFVVYSRKFVKE